MCRFIECTDCSYYHVIDMEQHFLIRGPFAPYNVCNKYYTIVFSSKSLLLRVLLRRISNLQMYLSLTYVKPVAFEHVGLVKARISLFSNCLHKILYHNSKSPTAYVKNRLRKNNSSKTLFWRISMNFPAFHLRKCKYLNNFRTVLGLLYHKVIMTTNQMNIDIIQSRY